MSAVVEFVDVVGFAPSGVGVEVVVEWGVVVGAAATDSEWWQLLGYVVPAVAPPTMPG